MLQQQISSLQIVEPYHIYDDSTNSSDLEGKKRSQQFGQLINTDEERIDQYYIYSSEISE